MIELALTNKEARKILRAIDSDPALSGVQRELSRWLDVEAARRQKLAPWRTVTGYDSKRGLNGAEQLECGHYRSLRYSRDWVEDRANKRRCQQCAVGRT